jgi:hypothetical protein
MRRIFLAGTTAVGVVLALPNPAPAQQRITLDDWWEWALPEAAQGAELRGSRGGRIVLPRPVERRPESRGKAKDGPPFCQNGQGHPVHGWQWCANKGFGRYGDRGRHRDRGRWERTRWEDVVFRSPRRYSDDRVLERGSLLDILGQVVLGRIEARGQRVAGAAPLSGRWAPATHKGGRVLQIRAGTIPLAELSDLDGDGRIDAVLLYDRN